MHSIPSCFGLVPLTDVAISKDAFPDALAFLESVCPLALVYLAVRPCVDTFSVRLPIKEIALISVSIRIAFHAATTPGIILPLAFVDARFAILHDAETLALPVDELATIDRIFVVLHAEVWSLT